MQKNKDSEGDSNVVLYIVLGIIGKKNKIKKDAIFFLFVISFFHTQLKNKFEWIGFHNPSYTPTFLLFFFKSSPSYFPLLYVFALVAQKEPSEKLV